MNMKQKALFVAAIAALAAAACSGPKMSETTVLTGSFKDSIPAEVTISVPDLKLDTTIAVENGTFKIEIPTNKLSLGLVKAGDAAARFIPDGTPLTANFADNDVVITSKYPEISSQMAMNAFLDDIKSLNENFQSDYDVLDKTDEAAQEALMDKYQGISDSICLTVLENNKDNYLAVMALDNVQYSLAPAELDELLNSFDEKVLAVPSVERLKKSVAGQIATAEGKMFTDFEVNGVKFSDFVGKGKYVLVDFWASWCGPCKREIPFIKDVYEKYEGDDFNVLSVAVWDKPEDTEAAAKEHGVVWSQIVDAQRIPTDIYGIQGIPHIMLVGPDGTIVKRNLRGADIEKTVSEYVKAKK